MKITTHWIGEVLREGHQSARESDTIDSEVPIIVVTGYAVWLAVGTDISCSELC